VSLDAFILQEHLRSELQPDEELLWSGQPDPRVLFSKADRFLVPFSLLWGGFALFWEGWVIYSLLQGETKSGNGGDLRFFAVFGLFFVAFGLYLMVGRFLAKRMQKSRTYYGVTNERLLTVCTLMGRRTQEIGLSSISSINKQVGSSGTDSLRFDEHRETGRGLSKLVNWFDTRRQQDYGNTGLDLVGFRSDDWPLAFYDIHDANEVEALVAELRSNAATVA
jgi:hypothetical protein